MVKQHIIDPHQRQQVKRIKGIEKIFRRTAFFSVIQGDGQEGDDGGRLPGKRECPGEQRQSFIITE